jgi:cytochrome P450
MSTDPFYNDSVPDRIPPELVHDFNVYDYGDRNPFELISEMHDIGYPELFWTRNNGGHWIAFGASAIGEITLDTARFSSVQPIVPESEKMSEPYIIPGLSDPPLHTGYRGVVAPLFAMKHVAKLETELGEYADEVALRIKARGHCEFMADFANEMPVVVFLRFLDLPIDDRFRLLQLATAVVRPHAGSDRNEAMENLINYARPVIEERFSNPGTDVISQIVQRKIDDRPLTLDEMLRLTSSVLLGGLETVTSVLGYVTHYLAEHPEARHYIRNNPAIIPNAVEEFLRRFPPATVGRIVTQDFSYRNVEMRKDDHVVWNTGMFNFDRSQVEDPMKVDFHRKRVQHATFGGGVHFCLGAFLARLELRVFLQHWLQKIPNFHVPEGTKLKHRAGLTSTLVELPIVIDPD